MTGAARAHEPGEMQLPDMPGWRLGAAAALVANHADDTWPTPRWPGVMVLGRSPNALGDSVRLEHAVLEAAARVNSRVGAMVAIGFHDREAAHVETARLESDWSTASGRWILGAGRDTVRMGTTIDRAGHLDRFNQAPLAKRAVLNDLWTDDGLTLAWQPADETWLQRVEAGVWRGRAFPGGPGGSAVPTMHLQAGWGHVTAHAFVGHLRPQGRGAAVASIGAAGHSHAVPDCRLSLKQVVCFDGQSDVASASLQWASDDERWTLSAAALGRQDRGTLYSSSGDAAYRANISGVWADVVWRATPDWTLALRPERLTPKVTLNGVGTALLAREGGLLDAAPVTRITLALSHTLRANLSLSLEAGQERQAGSRVNQASLRLVWQAPEMLNGRW